MEPILNKKLPSTLSHIKHMNDNGFLQILPFDLLYKTLGLCNPNTRNNTRSTNKYLYTLLSLNNLDIFLQHNFNFGNEKETLKLCKTFIKKDKTQQLHRLITHIINNNHANNPKDCTITIETTPQTHNLFITQLLESAIKYNTTNTPQLLIKNYNIHSSCYNYYLYLAAQHNSDKSAEALIALGVNINSLFNNTTPFHVALSKRNHAVLEVLIKHGDGIQEIETYKAKYDFRKCKVITLTVSMIAFVLLTTQIATYNFFIPHNTTNISSYNLI